MTAHMITHNIILDTMNAMEEHHPNVLVSDIKVTPKSFYGNHEYRFEVRVTITDLGDDDKARGLMREVSPGRGSEVSRRMYVDAVIATGEWSSWHFIDNFGEYVGSYTEARWAVEHLVEGK